MLIKIKSKKAWIRILEAFIAILLIASVLVYIYVKEPSGKSNEKIETLGKEISENVVTNDTLREEILNNQTGKADFFISRILLARAPYLGFKTSICNIEEACGFYAGEEKEVYAYERVVSSTLSTYKPVKFKLFLWEK